MPKQPSAYFGMPLNRNSALRGNPEWLDLQVNSENRRVTAIYNKANLTSLNKNLNFTALIVNGEQASLLIENAKQPIYLGHQLDTPVFVVDLTHLSSEVVDSLVDRIDPDAEFIDLRKSGTTLPQNDAAIFAYARGICHWHQQHHFCGRCGSRHQAHTGGHVIKCTNISCGYEVFPRLDPAVIMLVELINPDDGVPKCLLGRHKGLPPGIYSTLAGYVEIGETLEEAVAREVMEEAGVKISNPQYVSSQPWPFPASLMLGYQAQTTQVKLKVDYDELEDARWFSADEIRQFGEFDENINLALPRKDSIARTLIETWLEDQI